MSDAARAVPERIDALKWKNIGQGVSSETPKPGTPASGDASPVADAESAHPRLMLDFRFRSGDAIALSYAYLISAAFDRSHGIALDFSGYRATVSGRNLGSLYRAILEHRATQIEEMGEMAAAGGSDAATVVTRIQVKEKE